MTGAAVLRSGGPLGGPVVRCAVGVLRRRAIQRLLAVGGLAVAGWLLSGGGAAFADQVCPDAGAHHQTGAPVHPAPVDDRSAKATVSKPSAELDVLAGRARRAGSHSAGADRPESATAATTESTPRAAVSAPRGGVLRKAHRGTARDGLVPDGRSGLRPGSLSGSAPESSRGAASLEAGESPFRALAEAIGGGSLPKSSVVPELPPVPAPYEPGVPSLRPAAGAPGDTTAGVGARPTPGDKASAPAAGAKASAPGTGEEAAGAITPSTADGSQRTPPAGPQPASSGSSGAARTGATGETVPLGTARPAALPYGGRGLTRTIRAPRGEVPAMRNAADEPSFSPD